jgi:hypothetical protein
MNHSKTDSIRRQAKFALIGGFAITVVLTILSYTFVRLAPYRDKPMTPKPFFLYALSFGIFAAEAGDFNRWIRLTVYLLTNSLIYGFGLFILGTIWRETKNIKPRRDL